MEERVISGEASNFDERFEQSLKTTVPQPVYWAGKSEGQSKYFHRGGKRARVRAWIMSYCMDLQGLGRRRLLASSPMK